MVSLAKLLENQGMPLMRLELLGAALSALVFSYQPAVVYAIPFRTMEAAPKPVAKQMSLGGSSWELVAIRVNGKIQRPGASAQPITIQFDQGAQQVSGSSGCNAYGAAYVQDQGSPLFRDMVSSRRACADPAITALEGLYLESLGGATWLELVHEKILVVGSPGSDRTLIFSLSERKKGS